MKREGYSMSRKSASLMGTIARLRGALVRIRPSARGAILPMVVSVSILAACGGGQQQAGGESAGEERSARTGTETTTEQNPSAEAEDGNAVTNEEQGEATVGSADDGGGPREVTLEMGGDPGTEFSGTCVIGNEERKLRGQTPERFVYELDGRNLRCEIHKRSMDISTLEVVLSAGNVRYVQRAGARWATISLAYSDRGFSSSIDSSVSASSNSASQTITSSSSLSR